MLQKYFEMTCEIILRLYFDRKYTTHLLYAYYLYGCDRNIIFHQKTIDALYYFTQITKY